MSENTANDNDQKKDDSLTLSAEEPIQTQHEIALNGDRLRYTATTGMMPLKNDQDEIQANIFFMAYTLDDVDDTSQRPVMFVFNGGPGSSSVWLHMGAFGPKRVKMEDEGWMPRPPFRLVDNDQTWLDKTDLVFIDPVGTGFSRAKDEETAKQYWSLKGDIESVGEFIRLYLTRYHRWTSPLLLAGESYGTTRAAGIAGHLINQGIAFNGVVLVSTVLSFQTLLFERGNDLPAYVYLPTYTATAWYHKQLQPALQEKPLREVLDEVEAWTEDTYAVALAKGDRLSDDDRQNVIEQLAYYTGLETRYIDGTNLRVDIMRFCKELLRDQKRAVGRLDSRYTGMNALSVTEYFEFDPSMTAIVPPYTATFNDYVRRELGYETDHKYEILSYAVNGGWEYDRGKYPDTSEALRAALTKNPYMQVFAALGYYDLATPYFATHYTFNHMDLNPELRDNIHTADYEAGHMLYLDLTSLAKLKADFLDFLPHALGE